MHAARRTGRALILLSLPALALATITFENRWHWYIADVGRSATQLADGGYIISGGTRVTSGSYGVVLARTDSLGDTLSVSHILGVDADGGFSCGVADSGYAVLAESGGRIFVRGFSPAGDSLWNYQSTWRGPVSTIIPTSDGGCLVAGRIPDTAFDMGAIKLAADGHEEWARWYDEPRMYDSWAHGAAQTRDGGFVLCGIANDYVANYMRLARLRPNGDSAWTRTYHGPVAPMLSAVAETQDHGFLAAGSEVDTLQSLDALYLFRTDSLGALLWTRQVAFPGAATRAVALRPTSDSGYVIAGTIDWDDSARIWLVKIDADAETTWTAVLPGTGREEAASVEQTADGGYVIAGTSDSAGGSILLAKTDSLGRILSTGVSGPRSLVPRPSSLVVSPNPCHSSTTISCSSSLLSPHSSLSLCDVTGRLVLIHRSSFIVHRSSSFRLDLRSMPVGVYLLKLDYAGGSATRKLVVE
jgi:hypothetical protein